MSQTVFDPQSHVPGPTRESASSQYGVSSYPVTREQPNKSNGLSIAALTCAVMTIGLALFQLPTGIALAVAVVGLALGVLATVLGVMGRGRAVSGVLGIAGLMAGILTLAWTIGWVACTIW